MEDIIRVKSEAGIEIKPDFTLNDTVLEGGDVELSEAMVPRGANLVGRTLKSLQFRERYQLVVLGINRHGVNLLSKMSNVRLRFGDVLLVQGNREDVEDLPARGQVLLLEEISERQVRSSKSRWALLALSCSCSFPSLLCAVAHRGFVRGSNSFGYPVSRSQEMYQMIEWRLIVLIACMISFGVAMEKTGADQYLADLIVRGTGHYGPLAVLAGFFAMTVTLTQPMSNQAAALVMLPIAVKTALALGLNPRAFAVAVTYAASCSFLTPLEPACVLVYTPGQYRFLDFVKVGSILTIAVFAIVIWSVPIFWPLKP